MRISDWSSDVCSSDLRSARDRHIIAQLFQIFREHRQREMMVPQHKAVRLQIVRRVDQLIHLTDRLVTGVRHLGLAKPEPFCCRCARQERERLRRSEEHTSELQSLMRNSYAVFCL